MNDMKETTFHDDITQSIRAKDTVNNNFPKSVRGELVEPQCPSTGSGRSVHLEIGKLFSAMS
jgi:hypothetical protein